MTAKKKDRWVAHTGNDYACVMLPNETTDNASIHVYSDDEHLPLKIADALNALAAQPSAGAQGEAVGVDRDWMIKVIRERSLPQDAADMIIGAMRFAAAPTQPDTGDVAALREALRHADAVADLADELIEKGLRLTPDGLMVREARDNSDPHYRLCGAITERRKALAALSKPNAPGAKRGTMPAPDEPFEGFNLSNIKRTPADGGA